MPSTDQYFNFTKAAIEALPPPAKRTYFYDTRIRGLAIAVQPSGAKSFYLYRKVKGKPVRVMLGPFPDMTIEQARKKAEEVNGQIVLGYDPAEDRAKKRSEWTFEDLFLWYLEHHAKPRKRSWQRDEQNYKNHLAGKLGRLPLSKVTKTVVRETHMAISKNAGPYAANRLLALISVIFSKAIAHEIFENANPTIGIEPFMEHSRDRRLNSAELSRLLAALEQEPNTTIRDYVYMLLFTGARRDNVLSMRWEDIDFDASVWRIPMTKNGKPQLVPLEAPELAILQRRVQESSGGPWVFPGRKDTKTGHLENPYEGWYRILERANIEDLRLHDLRRSLGSLMVDTGASLPIIGQVLHHQSQSTTAIYARLALDPVRQAKRRALEVIEAANTKPSS